MTLHIKPPKRGSQVHCVRNVSGILGKSVRFRRRRCISFSTSLPERLMGSMMSQDSQTYGVSFGRHTTRYVLPGTIITRLKSTREISSHKARIYSRKFPPTAEQRPFIFCTRTERLPLPAHHFHSADSDSATLLPRHIRKSLLIY